MVFQAIGNSNPETQAGSGLNGGACDVCHLMVRSLLAFASKRYGAVGILFIDVTRAFPQMRRRIALPCDLQSEEELRRWLSIVGFSDDKVDSIIA